MRARRRRLTRQRKAQDRDLLTLRRLNDEWDDDDFDYDPDRNCHYCGGEGWGVVGCDWDCDDPINGPYDGEIERCPCCHGSGKAEDCTFW